MANHNHIGWERARSENNRGEIGDGWGNVGENKNKEKVTQWEHAGDLDNFVVVNNGGHKGKEASSSSSRGRPRNGNRGGGWRGRRDFGNQNRGGRGGRGGEWKGKRAASPEIGGWNRQKRAASLEIGGWNHRKRAASNENGGWSGQKRASSNGFGCNGGSQVSSGGIRACRVQTLDNNNTHRRRVNNGIRACRVQTLGNNAHGLNGHRVSLHFPAHSTQLQKILREDFSLPAPELGFQRQGNDPYPRPRQVNGPLPPTTPPIPTPANALQVYQRPVQEDKTLSRKVRVAHTSDGGWVMEVEEFH